MRPLRFFRCLPFLAASALGCGAEPADQADDDLAATASPLLENPLPNALSLADVDGDGFSELLQIAGNRVLVFRADWEQGGLYHLYTNANIKRLVTGDFGGKGRKQVLALLDDGTSALFDVATKAGLPGVADPNSLVEIGRQNSFLADGEQAIVGNFEGAGRDNVLAFNPTTGAMRMYRLSGGVFSQVSTFSLGNLASLDRRGLRFYSGRFRETAGRDDLLVHFPATGQVARYDSVTSGGLVTFWWAFTTNGGQVSSTDEISLGNLHGERTAVALHDKQSGKIRMFDAQLVSSTVYTLKPITDVDAGQLDQTTAGTQLAFAKLKTIASETGAQRDDALLFYADGRMVRDESRWDGTRRTYWWAFTKGTPAMNVGWPALTKPKWMAVKCKFKGVAAEPSGGAFANLSQANLQNLFTRKGLNTGGAYDYFRDTTYGHIDLSSFTVAPTWYQMDITVADAQKKYADSGPGPSWRGGLIDYCVNAARTATTNKLDTTGVEHFVAVVNDVIDGGAAGPNVLQDAGIDRPGDIGPSMGFQTHELGHGLGLNHMWSDAGGTGFCNGGAGEYCDPWDTMGDGWTYFWFGAYGRVAAELSAFSRGRLGAIPANRITTLAAGPSSTLKTVYLSAVERPEIAGQIETRIGIPGEDINKHYLSVELRQHTAWDRALPQDAVIVREVKADGLAYLQTNLGGPQRLAGWGWSGTLGGRLISVAVRDINGAKGTARIDVTN